jgi:quinol monooxygenase YgiN
MVNIGDRPGDARPQQYAWPRQANARLHHKPPEKINRALARLFFSAIPPCDLVLTPEHSCGGEICTAGNCSRETNLREETTMESLDRRTFVQAAVGGALTAAVLAVPSGQAAGPGDYFVIAEIVAKPGSADALRALLVPFAEKSRTEPGCKLYTLLEVESEPGRFLTYERWTDKAALQVHMTTPHIKEIVPKLEPVLAKPFTQIFLGAVSGA